MAVFVTTGARDLWLSCLDLEREWELERSRLQVQPCKADQREQKSRQERRSEEKLCGHMTNAS